jgi:hypothetical protein
MSDVVTEEPADTSQRLLPAPVLLLLGIVVIPLGLVWACNSWSSPGPADYIRMAFASVVGLTVSIATVLVLFLDRAIHGAPPRTVRRFALLASVVVLWSVQGIVTVAGNLTSTLERIG